MTRITDERLGEIEQSEFETEHEYALFIVLEAEREYCRNLEAKLRAVEGLPEKWRSCNESRHDPNNLIRCADELEAALKEGEQP